jgi:hypothetical protein
VKPHVLFASFVASFFILGCSKPLSSSYLLSAGSTTSDTGSTSTADDGDLAIQADNETLSMAIDDADKIEITGTCKDLNRKKNRILVEVFAGEDETVNPYISNSISDKCITTDSGLPLTDKCFWVTKGIGLVEGVPALQQIYPQCHDGKFAFAIKLGQILVNPIVGLANLKYTVRFKLRTLDGILADTAWSRVTVDRPLLTPGIDVPVIDSTDFACTITTTPARFNQNIKYTLNRSYTDSVGSVSATDLYTGAIAGLITTNDSVFSWRDDNNVTTHVIPSVAGILSGVPYNYTLTATESQFLYATAPKQASAVATCELPPPRINATLGTLPTANTCYVTMFEDLTAGIHINPKMGTTVTAQWAASTTPGWTGTTFSTPVGGTVADVTASCDAALLPRQCTLRGLAPATTYYIAMREVGYGQTGKWSNILGCTTPP